MKLTDQTAIVTGAGSGIGRAIAERFATEGAAVVCAGHHIESCQETADRIAGSGGQAVAVACDVSQAADVENMVAGAQKEYGSVDILVNNAGVVVMADLEAMGESQWDQVVDVDLKGTFLGMKYALPEMERAGKGKIINISSIAGLIGFSQIAAYAAAKGGVLALTKEAAVEYAPKRININAIAPGVIKTKMTDPMLQDAKAAAALESQIPYPRFGEPEDVAAAALYLASGESDFVNGETLVVDGGQTIH